MLWYIQIIGGAAMDYDKIIIDLLNRIVTLEERVAKLENGSANVVHLCANNKLFC